MSPQLDYWSSEGHPKIPRLGTTASNIQPKVYTSCCFLDCRLKRVWPSRSPFNHVRHHKRLITHTADQVPPLPLKIRTTPGLTLVVGYFGVWSQVPPSPCWDYFFLVLFLCQADVDVTARRLTTLLGNAHPSRKLYLPVQDILGIGVASHTGPRTGFFSSATVI